MAKIEKLLAQIKNNPKDVNFTDLVKICNHYFGEPRQEGTSHCVYKTPWAGDPRVNIQEKNGKAKVYQVKQVLEAINKIEDIENEQL
ncbi:toxin HicA [Gloeocapsopsis dulcis]|uniref:Toxin HicA n=1 Tax=Gloeocapsopsis dulcis AAB1 = 1H9 TaxID=1433147 RepID=A0A6N8FVP9_9CHRO|nr:toxin HicA [Gloeocapsopsis dulcis]MUL37153.1 toxin HicA [Gloeocapsopsis dulcis AAB1 = 1H9]WNN88437.1 toxin HicA [Gloeocapsopsis dulcis]